MKSNYRRVSNRDTEVHFSKAMFGEVEQSRMTAPPVHLTTLNAGDIVPVYCREILPHEHFSLDLQFDMRQTTILTPTMGTMNVDFYAFWVPNRVVNQSFKAVMGENYNGSWTGNPITLAPLVGAVADHGASIQVPVGSVADYYGFPTQAPIPVGNLQKMNDLKFRGYVMIYNEFFRDQNYQPPIPMSTLNVYQGFFDAVSSSVSLTGNEDVTITPATKSDGSVGGGAIQHALYGSGAPDRSVNLPYKSAINSFRALSSPLKANKLHDYFTSVLPEPQKSPEQIFVPVSGTINGGVPVVTSNTVLTTSSYALRMQRPGGGNPTRTGLMAVDTSGDVSSYDMKDNVALEALYPANLVVKDGAEVTGLAMSIEDLRMSAAIQQVYEALGRGGSRYREYLRSFFGLDVDDPFNDIPKRLGHIRRSLDLFQTAQTSASADGGTPQGNLAAFGYTSNGGRLFTDVTFLEHGYVHVMAVVRHKNIYSSFVARDNYRLSMLDFYHPQLANISEQPVFRREINPFDENGEAAIGYQEAWAEYRYEPDYVTGYMRPGAPGSVAVWNYADPYDPNFDHVDAEWLRSNSQEVLDRTLAVTSMTSHQFKLAVKFFVDKTLPMPVYSVPALDIM